MKEIVTDEEKEDIFSSSLENLSGLLETEKEADFNRSTDYIKRSIKREIMTKLFGQRGMYEQIILKTDPTVKKAFDLIKNDQEYTKIIEGEEDKAEL
jgi:hypothetical protein